MNWPWRRTTEPSRNEVEMTTRSERTDRVDYISVRIVADEPYEKLLESAKKTMKHE